MWFLDLYSHILCQPPLMITSSHMELHTIRRKMTPKFKPPAPIFPPELQIQIANTYLYHLFVISTCMLNKLLKFSMVERKILMSPVGEKENHLYSFFSHLMEPSFLFLSSDLIKTFWHCFKTFSKSEPFLLVSMNTSISSCIHEYQHCSSHIISPRLLQDPPYILIAIILCSRTR